jgi:hypothetical protein
LHKLNPNLGGRHPFRGRFATLRKSLVLEKHGWPPKAMCLASRNSYHGEVLLLPKTSMCQRVAPHHHALAPKIMMSSSKVERFSPPGKIIWQVRGGLGLPSHHQVRPSLISLIWHVDPWHPTCGLVAPWKPKLGLFSQNCPPTRSCKDK